MLTENDLKTIVFVYLGSVLAGWLVFWLMTRWVKPQVLRGQLRALVFVFVITPCPTVPGEVFGAPAWVVLMMDVLRNGMVTRQDAVKWFIVFGIVICSWALFWAILSRFFARKRSRRESGQRLAKKRRLAAAEMDEPFGDSITLSGNAELDETLADNGGLR